MSIRRVAVVTGSNKGIGYEIVRQLCHQFDGDVVVCSRDESRGKQAVEKLEIEGLNPKLAQLAVDDICTIKSLKDFLTSEYGGLDVLVNNAGIAYINEDVKPVIDIAKETLGINYFGALNVSDILFSILRPGARVVNISSSAGMLKRIPGKHIRERLSSPTLTRRDIEEVIEDFYSAILQGTRKEKGWPDTGYTSYIVSKVMLSALTWIQHREFENDPREDLVINAVHPGYVMTDLTGGKGRMTVEEGAKAPAMCCLVPPGGEPRGKMVSEDCSIVDWYNDILYGGASAPPSQPSNSQWMYVNYKVIKAKHYKLTFFEPTTTSVTHWILYQKIVLYKKAQRIERLLDTVEEEVQSKCVVA